MHQDLENILITKQINPTAMRLMVLEYILQQKAAISLTDLEQEFDRSDRVTLYRTLKTFEEKGLIHNIKDGNEAVKYAMCDADCEAGAHHDLHLHFYCTACRELFCLPATKIPDIPLPGHFKLKELSLVARGTCNNCN